MRIKKFNTNILLVKSFVHTSAVPFPNLINTEESTRIWNESVALSEAIISNLESQKSNKAVLQEDLKDLGMTSLPPLFPPSLPLPLREEEEEGGPLAPLPFFMNGIGGRGVEECFPWLIDDEGKHIDYNKSIISFKGVILISKFLEKKYGMEKDSISEVKLNELLEHFLRLRDNKNEVTVIQLFNHVSKIYNKDKDSFKILVEQISNESNNSTENINNLGEQVKPLADFGDLSLNEIFLSLKEFKWELIFRDAEFTINTIPLAAFLIGYILMLKSYMKYVHNKPYVANLNMLERTIQERIKSRNLALFIFMCAPFSLCLLKKSAISIKDIGFINIPLLSSIYSNTSNNSSLLLLLNNINNQIPNWVKLLFRLLFLSILLLKLLGFSSILVFLNNVYYIKIFTLFTCSLVIIYQLLNIYLLYKFTNKNIKISEVLPEFLINWLREFEIISFSKESIYEFKKTCYIQIFLYIIIIILINFIF